MFICKRSFLMIAFQKRRQDDPFLFSGYFVWIIHEPCFKNCLHNSIVVENIIPATIKVKNANSAIGSLI